VISFLCSLAAVLLSVFLSGSLNFVGVKHTYWFVDKFDLFFDIPFFLSALGLFSMLVGSLINIGGLYSWIVTWIAVGVGVFLSVTLFIVLVIFRSYTHNKIRKEAKKSRLQNNNNTDAFSNL